MNIFIVISFLMTFFACWIFYKIKLKNANKSNFTLQEVLNEERNKRTASDAILEEKNKYIISLENNMEALRETLRQLDNEKTSIATQKAILEKSVFHRDEARKKEIEELQKTVLLQFENLAGKILKENTV